MSHWVSSEIAASYRTFRPHYPARLFDRLAEIVHKLSPSPSTSSSSGTDHEEQQQRKLIIDIGCGSGQAIQGLMKKFPPSPDDGVYHYVGVDPSEAQLEEARKEFSQKFSSPGAVHFVKGDAGSENIGELAERVQMAAMNNNNKSDENNNNKVLPPASLVTVAQALHWFSIENFCNQLIPPSSISQENKNNNNNQNSSSSSPFLLLNPENGLVAAWLYSTTNILNSKECHRILHDFDKKLLNEGHWPKERWSIENLYQNQIKDFEKMGFDLVAKEVISDERESSLENLVQYLNTWSGVQRYEKELLSSLSDADRMARKGFVIEEQIRKPFIEALSREMKEEEEGEWKDSPTAMKMRFDFHLFVWKPNQAAILERQRRKE